MEKENKTGFVRPMRKQVQENPLIDMQKLFDAALTEFAAKSFESASLNDIIKASGFSKGSFYYKFSDKMDLYLCMIDRMSQEKISFFAQKYHSDKLPQDFFEQICFLVKLGIEFSLKEPRYYAFWRIHLAEGNEIKTAVKAAFLTRGKDEFEVLIRKAAENGQFKAGYPTSFIKDILELLVYNIDRLIKPDMKNDDILNLIDNLVEMLRNGLAKSN